MSHSYEFYAYHQTKTRRRELRRRIRAILGTSRDDAPTIRDALETADNLSKLLDDASSGRFKLKVWDEAVKANRTLHEARKIVSQSAAMGTGLLEHPLAVGDAFVRFDGVSFVCKFDGMHEAKAAQ